MSLKERKIDNSKESAIKTGKWSNPGAKFYDELLNSFYCEGDIPTDSKELDKRIKEGKYLQWSDFLQEAYLVAPIKDIKNSPYGVTPFSNSGCKYPHHALKGDSMVVSIPGLKAAYSRACQMGVIKGEVKDHLEKHIKELGIEASFQDGKLSWNENAESNRIIENNFSDINAYIYENIGIDLFDYYDEKSHSKLKYDFRLGWDLKTGHQLKVVYSLDNIDVTDVGNFYYSTNNVSHEDHLDYTRKNIAKKGNTDHQSKGQKVLAIIDVVTNKRLNSATLLNPFCTGINPREKVQSEIKDIQSDVKNNPEKYKKFLHQIKVGEIDNTPTYKSTHWAKRNTVHPDGQDFRWRQLALSEMLKDGRGEKVDNIIAGDLTIYGEDERYMHFHNPTKKQALNELEIRKASCKNIIKTAQSTMPDKVKSSKEYQELITNAQNKLNMIQRDIETIKNGKYDLSIMKKYRKKNYKKESSDIDAYVDKQPAFDSLQEIEDTDTVEESFEWIERFNDDPYFREAATNLSAKPNTPLQLLKQLESVQYGWKDNNGKIHIDITDADDYRANYRLQSPKEIIKSQVGVCWDITEFEREWFSKSKYEYAIIYIELNGIKQRPTHTFLIYKDGGKVCWFEHSFEKYRGIHKYDSVSRCIHDVINKNKEFWNIKSSSIIITKLVEPPKYGINCLSFMEYARRQIPINLKDTKYSMFRESMFNNEDILDSYFEFSQAQGNNNDQEDGKEANESKKKKDFVPIYGIIKQYSLSTLRNDGIQKDPGELSSVKFHKIIKKLTRGDNYSHALVSFDDSLTNMYSYEDEGFVVDNIMTKASWMGTSSIYICVMFVNREDRDRMKKFVKDLKEHQSESRYASANLLKAYVGTPYKIDKRFVCSSFTGYIMSCSNPKNLHRDYSRLRPEDITILPRSFYVMNVKDREDFIKHKDEIKKKVDAIFKEYHDEIDDYNNQLPKLMLQDRVDKLKTLDKIFDWIIDRM